MVRLENWSFAETRSRTVFTVGKQPIASNKMKSFDWCALEEAGRLFRDGEVETFVRRAGDPGELPGEADATVCVVHRPTGIEVSCDSYPSQMQNKLIAMLRLRIAVDSRSA
jgi:hypothetical protein